MTHKQIAGVSIRGLLPAAPPERFYGPSPVLGLLEFMAANRMTTEQLIAGLKLPAALLGPQTDEERLQSLARQTEIEIAAYQRRLNAWLWGPFYNGR